MAARFGATHAVRIGPTAMGALKFWRLPAENILLLDIESNKRVNPKHISTLLDFVYSLPADARLFIHCASGMTRSAAAAIITACALEPDKSPAQHLAAMLEASPRIVPQRRMLEIADDLLGLDGALKKAGDDDWNSRLENLEPFEVRPTVKVAGRRIQRPSRLVGRLKRLLHLATNASVPRQDVCDR
jgi:predicted protein tyrosine phosphatase